MYPARTAAGLELEQLLHEGCTFTVLDQPISLDRLQIRNIDQFNATGSETFLYIRVSLLISQDPIFIHFFMKEEI